MKNRKNQDKNEGKPNNKKFVVMLVSFVASTVVLISGSIAFMVAVDGPITNIFNRSVVSCQVNEASFDGNTKRNVTIQNTGDITCFIRTAIIVTWKDAVNSNVYAKKPIEGIDYRIDLNETDWFLGDDGFYYYKNVVSANNSTAPLIYSCTPVADNTPAGYGLNVEILASAIQSDPLSVVQLNWNVSVDTVGRLTN